VEALLLAPLFEAEEYLSKRPSPTDVVQPMGLKPGETFYDGLDCSLRRPKEDYVLLSRGIVELSADAAHAAVSKASTVEIQQRLFHSLARAADYGWSYVRTHSGELFRLASLLRRSIDVAKWMWYKIVAHEYVHPGHINVLEVRSALLALRWRTRSAKRIFTGSSVY
jgi:hypothetical protein